MLTVFRQAYPKFQSLFQFDQFNQVQQQCYSKIFDYQGNMIVSAPTSSGKTVLFELLITKLMNQRKTKCLYLAPIKSLCHQKFNSWKKKFSPTMHVMQLTGDTLQMQPGQFNNTDIYIATPEKIDYISRKNLNFLKQLNLLLIDQIHMLNMQDRGAILEAIVSRIMSINQKIRIMAVSATIPNIKQVAQWLKVPSNLICVFGPEYRPAKLHKVVLGFKPANNDFNFEKFLNFKLLQVIRQYSYGKGTLIFCQTQKGTQQACHKLVQSANSRQFVLNEHISMQLISTSQHIGNFTLKSLIPHGIAFHNASLSMKDRQIIEGLFLQSKLKVLCTTSTLAMGINLPARLVIIKSTKSYKGSGKGYQEYTQIQLDQMMGRAGRIPFDKQGTVVIMTQRQNYTKYTSELKLQNLQSQLYNQLIDHLNTEISLKSIESLKEAVQYFKNSFCYIRMMNSPKIYNMTASFFKDISSIKDIISTKDVEHFAQQTCLQKIRKLAKYEIIQYLQDSQRIFPRSCSINISRNAIEVDTMVRIIDQLNNNNISLDHEEIIKSQRHFLENILCHASQLVAKYRSKLDQRKCLKQLNEKNKYTLKQAISTAQKKCFVLVQAQLSCHYIENWQLRRQSSQMVYFMKRLAYCVKALALEKKHSHRTFWLYLFSVLYYKYFSSGFWQLSEQSVLKQLDTISAKWNNIHARGIRRVSDLAQGLNNMEVFGSGMPSSLMKREIQEELNWLNGSLRISLVKRIEQEKQQKINNHNHNSSSLSSYSQNHHHLLKLTFTSHFTPRFKSIHVIIEHNSTIYHHGYLNTDSLQFSAFLKNTNKERYFIAIIKEGYVGFDEFYWVESGMLRKTELIKEENDQKRKKLAKRQNVSLIGNQKRGDDSNTQSGEQQISNERTSQQKNKKTKSNNSSIESTSSSIKRRIHNNRIANNLSNSRKAKYPPKQINYINNNNQNNLQQSQQQKQPFQILPIQKPFPFKQKQQPPILSSDVFNKKSKQLKLTQNFNNIKRKYIHDPQLQQKLLDQNPFKKQLKRAYGYKDLKSYKWKPGFEEIKDVDENVQKLRAGHSNEVQTKQYTDLLQQSNSNHNVDWNENSKQSILQPQKQKRQLLLLQQSEEDQIDNGSKIRKPLFTQNNNKNFTRNNSKSVITQLNQQMQERYQPHVTGNNVQKKYQKDSNDNSIFRKMERGNLQGGNRIMQKNNSNDPNNQTNHNKQNNQKLLMIIDDTTKLSSQNASGLRRFPTQKQGKKLPAKIFFQDVSNRNGSNNNRTENLVHQKQGDGKEGKKKFKNAYEYFQSFFTDDQE